MPKLRAMLKSVRCSQLKSLISKIDYFLLRLQTFLNLTGMLFNPSDRSLIIQQSIMQNNLKHSSKFAYFSVTRKHFDRRRIRLSSLSSNPGDILYLLANQHNIQQV